MALFFTVLSLTTPERNMYMMKIEINNIIPLGKV